MYTTGDAERIEGLRMRQGRGRHSRVSAEQKYKLQGYLIESPEKLGYNTAKCSGSLLRKHIKNCIRLIINRQRCIKSSFQRAKDYYPERDEAKRKAVESDIKTLERCTSSSDNAVLFENEYSLNNIATLANIRQYHVNS